MTDVPRPILVVSRCLELDACRYNGATIRAPLVSRLSPFVELRPVCPEVEIGLGVPRDPIRIVTRGGSRRLLQPATGRDLTEEMERFADEFLDAVGEVDGFLLKSRSPSCGIEDTKIYGPDPDGPVVDRDAGLFGHAVLARFPGAAVEDEARLMNARLRHHFLTKLFVRAEFRRVRRAARLEDLVRFHTRHKLLLMAYHQDALRRLDRLVANADRAAPADVLARYAPELDRALARPTRASAHRNVLTHALGYVTTRLTSAEKRHFLTVLDEYRAGRADLSGLLTLVESFIARTDDPYLATQSYFAPYPRTLRDPADSGAPREGDAQG